MLPNLYQIITKIIISMGKIYQNIYGQILLLTSCLNGYGNNGYKMSSFKTSFHYVLLNSSQGDLGYLETKCTDSNQAVLHEHKIIRLRVFTARHVTLMWSEPDLRIAVL